MEVRKTLSCPQYYLTKLLWTVSCLRHRPPTTVSTWNRSGHLGRRPWISQTAWLSAILESEEAWCIFHPAEIPWSASHRSKPPSRNVAAPGFCWLDQHVAQAKCVWATHFIQRTTRGWCLWARSWATIRSRRNCATTRTWCSLFCETWLTIHSRRNTATLRSIGTTRPASPSDLMTRLCQGGRCFPRLSSTFSWPVVISMFLSQKKNELLFQMFISVSQLSICGAVADMIEEITTWSESSGVNCCTRSTG